MTTTKLWQVRAELVARFRTALAEAKLTVFDGPPAQVALPKQFVIVGSDGGADGFSTDDGSTARQTPSPMGNDWWDEDGVITCAAWAWSGSTKIQAHREQTSTAIELCVATVQADPRLGGILGPADRMAFFAERRISEFQMPSQSAVRAAFDIAYTALIT